MLPAGVPRPKDDKTARAHLRANVQAAADGDLHPGHWELHSWFRLPAAPGDFTPVPEPDYAEIHQSPLAQLLGYLGEAGPDLSWLTAEHMVAEHAAEAGQ
jgi:hypothetical protein